MPFVSWWYFWRLSNLNSSTNASTSWWAAWLCSCLILISCLPGLRVFHVMFTVTWLCMTACFSNELMPAPRCSLWRHRSQPVLFRAVSLDFHLFMPCLTANSVTHRVGMLTRATCEILTVYQPCLTGATCERLLVYRGYLVQHVRDYRYTDRG